MPTVPSNRSEPTALAVWIEPFNFNVHVYGRKCYSDIDLHRPTVWLHFAVPKWDRGVENLNSQILHVGNVGLWPISTLNINF